MDRNQLRLKKTRSLIDQVGGQSAFATKLDMSDSQVSQFAGEKPIRNIGNKVAGKIEAAFNLPTGWLDLRDSFIVGVDELAKIELPSPSIQITPEKLQEEAIKLLSMMDMDDAQLWLDTIRAASSKARRARIEEERTKSEIGLDAPPLVVRRA